MALSVLRGHETHKSIAEILHSSHQNIFEAGLSRLFRQDSNHCGSAGLGFWIDDIVDRNRDALTGLEVFTLQNFAGSSDHRGFLVNENGLGENQLLRCHLFDYTFNVSRKEARGG